MSLHGGKGMGKGEYLFISAYVKTDAATIEISAEFPEKA